MGLTNIADQKTPGRPIEIVFAPNTALPSANQEVLLIGHRLAGGSSGTIPSYTVQLINNCADSAAAKTEAETYFGVASELSKMVVAAVKANEATGGSNFPQLKCVALASTDADFGAADAALTAAKLVKAEFVVSPYEGTTANASTLTKKLSDAAATMSGAQRVENNQFGTFGVVFNKSTSDPSTLPKPDTQYLIGYYLRDGGTPAYSVGESAAACAAVQAANTFPFNPLDDVVIGDVAAPAALSDYLSIGAGLESETALNQGWTPLKVKPNGDVAFVRTVTTRVTIDGTVVATSYYDVQDFQVLYYWRKTLFTRWSQPDLKQAKASIDTAKLLKSEMLRLAHVFQDSNAFQAVDQLASQFKVQRSTSDRHRFDALTPVNVVPGLHVIATQVQAGVQFDTLSL